MYVGGCRWMLVDSRARGSVFPVTRTFFFRQDSTFCSPIMAFSMDFHRCHRFSKDFRSIFNRCSIDFRSIFDRFGVDLGSIWGRSGVDLVWIWGYPGLSAHLWLGPGCIWSGSGVDMAFVRTSALSENFRKSCSSYVELFFLHKIRFFFHEDSVNIAFETREWCS